jgi:hypothetical protein
MKLCCRAITRSLKWFFKIRINSIMIAFRLQDHFIRSKHSNKSKINQLKLKILGWERSWGQASLVKFLLLCTKNPGSSVLLKGSINLT